MGKGLYLGEFEQLVMLALRRLKDGAYGMTVRREIEKTAERDVSIGAVYATLDRLQGKGYVDSAWGEKIARRGGKAKRFYRLTPEGSKALRHSRAILEKMWKDVESPAN